MLNEEVLKLIWYITFFAKIYSILFLGRGILKCFYVFYGLCILSGLEEGEGRLEWKEGGRETAIRLGKINN